MNPVELRDVAVAPILAGVTLCVRPGERVALLGDNGAGKSTLLDVVLGLRPVSAGEVRVFGRPPPSPDVGFVPQTPGESLLPWLSVRDNVLLPLRAREIPCDDGMFEAARRAVDPEGSIDPRAFPQALSGGQQQLVALMRALVGRPRLLLCDEPFSAVDAPGRVRLRRALDAVCRAGPALLLVSHDVEDVLALADRAIVLAGRPARPLAPVERHAGRAALERALMGPEP
jgi:NitT/TauT family transport system ATP-binding protein